MKLINGSKIVAILVCLIFASVADISQAQPISFQGLGDLTGGDTSSTALGISGDGSTAVGSSSSADGSEAFRWTLSEGMVGLGFMTLDSFMSTGNAASYDGAVVVGSDRSTVSEAFRWTSGVFSGLGDLSGGTVDSRGQSVSADGSVVVGYSSSTLGTEAFRWTQSGSMVGLGDLPGGDSFSFGMDVSADGSIVVGNSGSDIGGQAFQWTESGSMEGLGHPVTKDFSQAWAISSDGSVIVGSAGTLSPSATLVAYLWTGVGSWQSLGDLAGGDTLSEAYDVSADGSVIVGYGTTETGTVAFIWDAENHMRNLKAVLESDYGLDLTGWTLTEATGISADALTIVGNGINPCGYAEGWIATIPEPASMLLLGLGGLVLLKRRRG